MRLGRHGGDMKRFPSARVKPAARSRPVAAGWRDRGSAVFSSLAYSAPLAAPRWAPSARPASSTRPAIRQRAASNITPARAQVPPRNQ